MRLIERIYRKNFVHRYDDTGYLHYFTAADYPGLRDVPCAFFSGGNRLSAHLYRYDDCREDTLVVFCHGIGGGHRSYLQEIVQLCKRGFPVFAYDNTGCFDSQGESIRCACQSLADLDSALKFLKREGIFNRYRRVCVVGHSWGGYAAGCVPLYHTDVEKVIDISGFCSVTHMLEDSVGGAKDPVRRYLLKQLCAFERTAAPIYYDASVLKAVNAGGARFMLVQSDDDPVVKYEHAVGLVKERAVNPETVYLIYHGRMHNPNYTQDAAVYLAETFQAFNADVKAGRCRTLQDKQRFFSDVDWERMTRQDEAFWDAAAVFLRE